MAVMEVNAIELEDFIHKTLRKAAETTDIREKFAFFNKIEQFRITDEQAKVFMQDTEIQIVRSILIPAYLDTLAQFEKQSAIVFLTQKQTLQHFSKYQHFVKRADLEYDLLQKRQPERKPHICVIGSGSMPLTAIYFAEKHQAKVTLVDRDSEAIELSRMLIDRLNLAHFCNFAESDILDFIDFKLFTHIIMANSVGQTVASKTDIINHVVKNMYATQLLMVRQPKGIFCLLNETLPLDYQIENADVSEVNIDRKDIQMRRLMIRKHF